MSASKLESQVDELLDTFNDIAKLLGKETVAVKTENLSDEIKEKKILPEKTEKLLEEDKVC